MRSIEVSTDTFSLIWSLRRSGEESEDSILKRVLSNGGSTPKHNQPPPPPVQPKESSMQRPTWRSDVYDALKELGGKAPLDKIYDRVEKIRRAKGRTVPPSLEATIRRTLEDHSTDSHNYRGGPNLFHMAEGKGRGVWALR